MRRIHAAAPVLLALVFLVAGTRLVKGQPREWGQTDAPRLGALAAADATTQASYGDILAGIAAIIAASATLVTATTTAVARVMPGILETIDQFRRPVTVATLTSTGPPDIPSQNPTPEPPLPRCRAKTSTGEECTRLRGHFGPHETRDHRAWNDPTPPQQP